MLVYFYKRNLQKKPTLLALGTGVGGEVRGWGIRECYLWVYMLGGFNCYKIKVRSLHLGQGIGFVLLFATHRNFLSFPPIPTVHAYHCSTVNTSTSSIRHRTEITAYST